ncbi:MAG: hypothetical protein ACYCS4_11040 [Acidimicrobiales bacterium]
MTDVDMTDVDVATTPPVVDETLAVAVEDVEADAGLGGPPYPWDIRYIGDDDWRALGDWVRWLRWAYQLDRTIPPCWYRHVGMAMELAALWCSWGAAYEVEGADASAPVAWHNQALSPFLARCDDPTRHNQGCTAGKHQAHVDAPVPGGDDGLGRWLVDWDGRPQVAGPNGFTRL